MLVLSRKHQESILIDGNIQITVLKVNRNTVSIGIEAPRDVSILRGELNRKSNPAIAPADGGTAISAQQNKFTEMGALI